MSLTGFEEIELACLLKEEEFQDRVLPHVLNGEPGRSAPLWWLQECTRTYDEKWQTHGFNGPYQWFPKMPYFPWLFDILMTTDRLLIPKSREMMVSWCIIGYAVWLCQTRPQTRVIVQTQKEGKAVDLIKGAGVPGYGRTLYEEQSDRLKEEFPLTKPMEDQPCDSISWKNGSILQGVPSGPDQIRLYDPTVVCFDEAAYLDNLQDSWAAALPVAQQMIAVSSVAPGAFWEWCRRPTTPWISVEAKVRHPYQEVTETPCARVETLYNPTGTRFPARRAISSTVRRQKIPRTGLKSPPLAM